MRNKNWWKIVISEVAMVILTLGVFFGCRWYGMAKQDATAVAVAVAAVAAVISVIATTEEYKLPKFWVVTSYAAEAVAIFVPILLSLN